MSDPINPWYQMIPFAVLGASLLGSSHCLAMCGGIVLTLSRSRQTLTRYHFGRLMGYTTLGALAGHLGDRLFHSPALSFSPWISSLVFALSFLAIGLRLWQGKPIHLFQLSPAWFQHLSHQGPFYLGCATAFLPCGWLHTFLLGAVATQSAQGGAIYLSLFWLGTLPPLIFGPALFHRMIRPFTSQNPRFSAIIFLALGLGSLTTQMLSSVSSSSCHHPRSTHSQGEPHSNSSMQPLKGAPHSCLLEK